MCVVLSRELNIAVVGMGKMGILHSAVLRVIPRVRLVALCEKSAFTVRLLKKLYKNVQVVDDLEKLADQPIDAVYVTTPIPSHFPIAKTILQKRIASNLFVEKTLANNYEQSKELCEIANHVGSITMVGYLRRFYVTFKKSKDLISEGSIGELRSFKAHALSSDLLQARKDSQVSASRGGVLRDLGCHAIDLALWFFGDLTISSARLKSNTPNGSEDIVSFKVENSEGLDGDFDISWCNENYRMPEVEFSVTGSRGVLQVNDDMVKMKLNNGKTSTFYRHDLDDTVPFWLGLPEYYREDFDFVNAVMANGRAEPDFMTASRVDSVIDQVLKRADRIE